MIEGLQDRYHCSNCGHCCENTRERASDELRLVLERSQGVNGYYYLPNTRYVGAYLFEWEVVQLSEIARETGIKFQVSPRHVFLDSRLKHVLIMEWTMDFKRCPFHNLDGCSIYEHRPMICRQYPVIDICSISERCSEIITPPDGILGEKLDAWMEVVYGESNTNALLAHDILEHNYGTVAKYCRSGMLSPAIGWDLRIVNRLAKNNSKGFFAYLVENGLMNKEDYNKRIEQFSSPISTRQLI